MAGERKLIVGYDLCEDYSQISCYNDKKFEPESICEDNDETKYLIPTVLAVRKDTKEWLFGTQAIEAVRDGDALLIKNFMTAIMEEKPVRIFETEFTGAVLLEKFFRKTLSLLKLYYPNDAILNMVITVKKLDKLLAEGIYQALEVLGIERDRAFVQSHSQSYMYYVFSQKKELWMNDIGLFEFDRDGFYYRQISVNRKHEPIIASIAAKDFSDTLNYELLEEQSHPSNLEYSFDNIAQNVLHRQIVSTLYITGQGFEGGWANDVLKRLCTGRRVFVGQNLFTKGACYAARAVTDNSKYENFLFLTEDMSPCSVSIQAYKDARIREIPILKEGMPWYEAESQVDVIIDEENGIDFVVKNVVKRTIANYRMELDGMLSRPAKMTRIGICAELLSSDICKITVRDKGFGTFYPAGSQNWEYLINF